MKTGLTLLSVLFFTINAHADVGAGTILKCGKAFTINKTAVPNLFQGQLKIGQNNYTLNCTQSNEELSSIRKLWDCSEGRTGEGRYLVTVQTGGAAGSIVTAYIEQEEIMEPMHVATLTCK